MQPIRLKIKDVQIDPSVHVRAKMDEGTLADYEEAVRKGVKLPPIEAFLVDGQHIVADGSYRHEAHRRAGCEEILCHVTKGTISDCRWAAAGSNFLHGMRPSLADRKIAVANLVQDPVHRETPVIQIALRCGVDPKTVVRIAHSMGMDLVGEKLVKRTSKSGKTTAYKQKPKGTNAKPSEDAGSSTPAPSKSAPKKKPVKDKTNAVVPDYLLPVVKDTYALDEFLTQVSAIVPAAEKLKLLKSEAGIGIDPKEISEHVQAIRTLVKKARFYAVCPECTQGFEEKANPACSVCGGYGWLSDEEYHNHIEGKK